MDVFNDEKLVEGRLEEMWKYEMDVELWKIKRYININVDKLGGILFLLIFFIYCINNIYRNMYEERKWIVYLYFLISLNFCNFYDKLIYEISMWYLIVESKNIISEYDFFCLVMIW